MTWWLSFCGDQKDGFLGVCVVDAEDFQGAVVEAWARKINPGGECLGFDLPDDVTVPDAFKNRLLSRDEAEAANDAILIEGDGGPVAPKFICDKDNQP